MPCNDVGVRKTIIRNILVIITSLVDVQKIVLRRFSLQGTVDVVMGNGDTALKSEHSRRVNKRHAFVSILES